MARGKGECAGPRLRADPRSIVDIPRLDHPLDGPSCLHGAYMRITTDTQTRNNVIVYVHNYTNV